MIYLTKRGNSQAIVEGSGHTLIWNAFQALYRKDTVKPPTPIHIVEVSGQIFKPTSPKTAWRYTDLVCGTPGWKFNAVKRDNVRKNEKDKSSEHHFPGTARPLQAHWLVQLEATKFVTIFFFVYFRLEHEKFWSQSNAHVSHICWSLAAGLLTNFFKSHYYNGNTNVCQPGGACSRHWGNTNCDWRGDATLNNKALVEV